MQKIKLKTGERKTTVSRDEVAKAIKDMKPLIQQIISEMGATNVKDIYYDDQREVWAITYKSGSLKPDEFSRFKDALDFIETETSYD